MSKPLYISYSAATRYKSCPNKYFLAKRYETRLIGSALPFGKAVEAGVELLLKGKSLEEACEMFANRWEMEDERGKPRPVFDNLAIEYYASDFDSNILDDVAKAQIQEWSDELIPGELHWQENFDRINDQMKADESKVSTEELTYNNRVVWLCCLIRGQVMIQAFHDKLLPKITLMEINKKPAAQIEVAIEGEGGDKVVGFIDFVIQHKDYKEPIIVDLKTGAYPYEMHALVTSEQLRTYVAAKGAEYNTRRAGYIVLIKKIKIDKSCNACGCKREGGGAKNCRSTKDCKGQYLVPSFEGDVQFITREYQDDVLEDVLNDYSNITTAIKHEVNFKNTKACNDFNRKCEFYDVCWGGANPQELEHLKDKEKKDE